MNLNSDTNVGDSQDEIYSTLSQISPTTNKKPSPTKYFGLSTLSMLERNLLILNIGLVVILLPTVITSLHKIGKIHGMILC